MLSRRDMLGIAGLVVTASPALASGLPSADMPLPDGEVSRSFGLSAWLVGPTTRYRHAVLGDGIEATGFAVERGRQRLTFRLGQDAVFEDRRVRLLRLTGVDEPAMLVVKAYQARGAALALYRLETDRIVPLAESAAIGQPNRWLNPIGAADFTGSGEIMIAAVITPHLSGSLRLYRLRANAAVLEEVQRLDGLTNHIIGSRDLDLGHVVPAGVATVPLIVLPTLDRRKLAVVTCEGGSIRIIKLVDLAARIVEVAAPKDRLVRVRLDDGTTRAVPLELHP